jgi:hypothetical protein
MACYVLLSQHLQRETNDNHRNLNQVSQPPDRKSILKCESTNHHILSFCLNKLGSRNETSM